MVAPSIEGWILPVDNHFDPPDAGATWDRVERYSSRIDFLGILTDMAADICYAIDAFKGNGCHRLFDEWQDLILMKSC